MTQTIPLGSDARERFVLEIANVLAPERIVEAYFFAPLRQGQIETGVCVLAALPEGADPQPTEPVSGDSSDTEALAEASAPAFPEGARISSRHVVYSARYRWTRKGPERGKWECEVIAEADAPLITVEAVVQGVQRRASEPLEVQKIDGDAVRAMVAEAQRQWPKTA
ncbi:hypothetical protein Strain138_000771 [Pseudogemmatithrix spongiicola]|uniref:Uncharacterized protein n=1 Tax=Pseudogemmatithrix spongiicola TaxID=3062599 RepID=A0AA49Q756_9BACT|nr:hypothetical protein Strain138_000771 [Gemmatimonadaceae bacterium 'strain 138']WKW14426.1 hypothetical protein Strain318_000771 [Gemmatimonadaceae bacterium 'strain 318']